MLPTTGGRSACRASAPNGMASAPVKEVSRKRRRSMRGSPPERVRSNGWLGVIFVHALLLSHPALVDSLPGSVRTDHCKPGIEPGHELRVLALWHGDRYWQLQKHTA